MVFTAGEIGPEQMRALYQFIARQPAGCHPSHRRTRIRPDSIHSHWNAGNRQSIPLASLVTPRCGMAAPPRFCVAHSNRCCWARFEKSIVPLGVQRLGARNNSEVVARNVLARTVLIVERIFRLGICLPGCLLAVMCSSRRCSGSLPLRPFPVENRPRPAVVLRYESVSRFCILAPLPYSFGLARRDVVSRRRMNFSTSWYGRSCSNVRVVARDAVRARHAQHIRRRLRMIPRTDGTGHMSFLPDAVRAVAVYSSLS